MVEYGARMLHPDQNPKQFQNDRGTFACYCKVIQGGNVIQNDFWMKTYDIW